MSSRSNNGFSAVPHFFFCSRTTDLSLTQINLNFRLDDISQTRNAAHLAPRQKEACARLARGIPNSGNQRKEL